MSRRFFLLLLSGLTGVLIVLSGCGRRFDLPQEEGPLGVEVSYPVRREVIDSEEFTGRLDAVYSVDVKPQVTGKLLKMLFKEGTEVKKGALLFEIDPEQYQAQYDVGQADVELAQAKLALAKADNRRAKAIAADNPAAISKQDLDTYDAKEKEAKAALDSAKSKMKAYEINLRWCKLYSDIDGQISRYYLTTGNLVTQNQTLLTTVVSVDPIYTYFDMDERTLVRIRDAIQKKRIQVPFGEIPIVVALTNETGFPHKGTINFVNNKVDPLTGTITVRGVFQNPLIDATRRLMTPGMYVRVQIPLSNPYPALLVSEKVILTDQGLKNVFIVDENNEVKYRRVVVGAGQPDGLRVVTGLKPTDRVVVSNLQQLHPDLKVEPELIPMPKLDLPGSANFPSLAVPPPKDPSKPAEEGNKS